MIDRISPSRIAASSVADAQRLRQTAPTSAEGTRANAAAAPSLIGEPRRMAAEGPPIDGARVERLRAGIADGSYAVDPERIAAAMIAAERQT